MSDRVGHSKSVYTYMRVTTKAISRNVCISIAALIATASSATAAQLVVVASSGSTFKVGQVVEASTDIKLSRNAAITLISQSGRVFALKGPRSGPLQVESPKGEKGGLIPSIKKILSAGKTDTATLGVMRSLGAPAVPQSPWAIPVSKSGKYCISLTKPVVLWRAGSQRSRDLVLKNMDNDHTIKVLWSSGQNTLYWPRLLPLIDGATYRVDLAGETRMPKLTVAMVPDLPTQAHAAVWMAENGCRQQALRLIKNIN